MLIAAGAGRGLCLDFFFTHWLIQSSFSFFLFLEEAQYRLKYSELQTRGGTEDNSKTFLIS